jgi:hypothetical protein
LNRLLPYIAFLIAIAGFTIGLMATEVPEVPDWIMAGILRVESRSYLLSDGSIRYVDRRVGSAGEVGPFQMRSIALRQVGLASWRWLVREDMAAAEYAATLFLRYCYRRTGSWWSAVGLYHSSDPGEAAAYAARVWAFRTF